MERLPTHTLSNFQVHDWFSDVANTLDIILVDHIINSFKKKTSIDLTKDQMARPFNVSAKPQKRPRLSFCDFPDRHNLPTSHQALWSAAHQSEANYAHRVSRSLLLLVQHTVEPILHSIQPKFCIPHRIPFLHLSLTHTFPAKLGIQQPNIFFA